MSIPPNQNVNMSESKELLECLNAHRETLAKFERVTDEEYDYQKVTISNLETLLLDLACNKIVAELCVQHKLSAGSINFAENICKMMGSRPLMRHTVYGAD